MSTQTPSPVFDVLDLPLTGQHLIEASAGTGKTWTLVALYLRLVLEQGLAPAQILLVTFTRAATAELSTRVRERLTQQAAAFRMRIAQQDFDPREDSLCTALCARFPAVQWPQCLARLEAALSSFEQSAIHTIHGFCQRALSRHALRSGVELGSSFEPDSQALFQQAIDTLWQEEIRTSDPVWLAWFLRQKESSPEAWASLFQDWIEAPFLQVEGTEDDAADAYGATDHAHAPAVHSVEAALIETLAAQQQHRDDLHARWEGEEGRLAQQWLRAQAQEKKVGGNYRESWLAKSFREWFHVLRSGDTANLIGEAGDLETWARRLCASDIQAAQCAVLKKTKPAANLPAPAAPATADVPAFFRDLEDFAQTVPALEAACQQRLRQRYAALLPRLRAHFESIKRARGVMSFHDALLRLDTALHPTAETAPGAAETSNDSSRPAAALSAPSPPASRLALIRALREEYRAALIDEFQDTDALQFRIFWTLFAHEAASEEVSLPPYPSQAGPPEVAQSPLLVLVGDPKQAIYAFRGAELHTYLYARRQIPPHQRHVLHDNHRSRAALLDGIERLFRQRALPFRLEGIAYPTVRAARTPARLLLRGAPQEGLGWLWLAGKTDENTAEKEAAPKTQETKNAEERARNERTGNERRGDERTGDGSVGEEKTERKKAGGKKGNDDAPSLIGPARAEAAGHCAERIAQLLRDGRWEITAADDTKNTPSLAPPDETQPRLHGAGAHEATPPGKAAIGKTAVHATAGAPVAAGDIAVLCRTHNEIAEVQAALRRRGIPCVTQSRESVLHSEEARDLLQILAALTEPTDARLRAALFTPIWGLDAPALVRILGEPAPWAEQLAARERWRALWRRSGVQAALSAWLLESGSAVRIAHWEDGERRLTNLLHLFDLLEQLSQRRPGMGATLDAFRTVLAEPQAQGEADACLMRLESDASRVRLYTIHAAKGLEFPIVFCPYLWCAPKPDDARYPLLHTGSGTVLDLGSPRQQERRTALGEEREAENLRQLYVALTRAQNACYLSIGEARDYQKSALGYLLQGDPPPDGMCGDPHKDAPRLRTRIDSMIADAQAAGTDGMYWASPGTVHEAACGRTGHTSPEAAQHASPEPLHLAHCPRKLSWSWRISSFSSLTAHAHAAPLPSSSATGYLRLDEKGQHTPLPEDATVEEQEKILSSRLSGHRPPLGAGQLLRAHAGEAGGEEGEGEGEGDIKSEAAVMFSPALAESWEADRLNERTLPFGETGWGEEERTLEGEREREREIGDEEDSAGREFGKLVHALLEHWDPQCTALAPGERDHPALRALILRLLPLYPRAVRGNEAQAVRLLGRLLARILATPLTEEGHTLAQTSSRRRVVELDFTYTLAPFRWQELAALLAAPDSALPPAFANAVAALAHRADSRVASGYLHGYIDLLCQLGERHYVIDWKTNRLPDYHPATLQTAMADAHYYLQALIYCLALHRLLRTRLPHYTPAHDLGGAIYLFVRGAPAAGVWRHRPDARFLDRLETLLCADRGDYRGAA